MKKTLILLLLSLTIYDISSAQKHDRLWHMGYQGGSQSPNNDHFGISILDFTDNQLSITDNQEIEIEFFGTNVSFCDSDGNLMLSSNGVVLVDSTFQVMPDGHDFSDYSDGYHNLPQGVLALPFPEEEDETIFLFAEKDIIIDPPWSLEVVGLYKFIIDMTKNNGLGAVSLRRTPLIIDTLQYGKLTATQHANGRDWWVVVNKSHSNVFYKLLLTPEGIDIYDQQTVGQPNEEGLGQAVFSPDGKCFVMFSSINATIGQFVQIYDFDRCTGKISNHRRLHFNVNGGGGIAIAPNSRYLFVSSFDKIFQYDLWSNDIESTQQIVAIYDGFESPFPTRFFLAQLAPDGKIYLNFTSSGNVLHVIHNPNRHGLACDVEQHGIQLPTTNASSLPNHPNYRLGPLDGSPCDTLGLDNIPVANFRVDQDTSDYLALEFADLSYYEPAEWQWTFGDGSSSTDTCPAHTYIKDGIYEVCLTVSNINGEHTDCRTLNLGITALEEVAEQIAIHIAPNPCTDFFNLSLGNYLPKNALLQLFDNSGRQVKIQRLWLGVNRVELMNLASGIYHFTIVDGGVLLKGGKVVKM